jgi:hypothetical protein
VGRRFPNYLCNSRRNGDDRMDMAAFRQPYMGNRRLVWRYGFTQEEFDVWMRAPGSY